MDDSQAWSCWLRASGDPAVGGALAEIFAALDAEITSRNPTCWLSGRCCHFDTYGHRLYVTGLEIAWLIGQLDENGVNRLREPEMEKADGCPFQVNKLCGVHHLRPLGCRIFFCDTNAGHWQDEVYESFLKRIKQLHGQFDLPYRYMEWRAGLAEIGRAMSLIDDTRPMTH